LRACGLELGTRLIRDIWWLGSTTGSLIKGSLLMRPSCFSCKRCHTHRLSSRWGISTTRMSAGKAIHWDANNPGESWRALRISPGPGVRQRRSIIASAAHQCSRMSSLN